MHYAFATRLPWEDAVIDAFARYVSSGSSRATQGIFVPDEQEGLLCGALFNKIVAREIKELEHQAAYMSAEVRLIGRRGVDVTCGVVISESLSCWCTRWEGEDLICISSNLLVLIYRTILRSISEGIIKSVIWTGKYNLKPKRCKIDLNRIVVPVEDIEEEIRDLEDGDELILESMFSDAIRWIIHHELAHIWFGHLEYVGRTYGALHLVDGDAENREPISSDVLKSLELDADYRAAYFLIISRAIDPLSSKSKQFWKPYSRHSPESIVFLLTILAVQTTICLLETQRILNNKNNPRHHPSNSMRLAWNRNCFLAPFAKAPEDARANMTMITDLVSNTLMFLINISISDLSVASKAVSLEYDRFEERWLDIVWASLHRDLDRLKRGESIRPSVYPLQFYPNGKFAFPKFI